MPNWYNGGVSLAIALARLQGRIAGERAGTEQEPNRYQTRTGAKPDREQAERI